MVINATIADVMTDRLIYLGSPDQTEMETDAKSVSGHVDTSAEIPLKDILGLRTVTSDGWRHPNLQGGQFTLRFV